MSNPLVSSITYVKNGEKYIEQCIRSIMDQTLQNIEIIVVDGGSTDRTMSILQTLQAEDERIILLSRAGSVGAQFNTALAEATGSYIAVCEGDDYILPEKYEKQYKIAKEYDLDVLRSNYYSFFQKDGRNYQYEVETAPSKEKYDRFINWENDAFTFLSLHVNGFWNGLYSREFLLKHNIYMNETGGASYQDITFSFLTQLYAKKVWFMKECLHCYRIDNPDASVNSKNCIERLKTEYSLLKSELVKRELWEKYQSMFLLWEVYTYNFFADRFCESDKDRLLTDIYCELKNQEIQFDLKGCEIGQKARNILEVLQDGNIEGFLNSMKDCDEKNHKARMYFKEKELVEKKVILFGVGHMGGIIYDYLKSCDKEVLLVDNSSEKQISGFRGEKVYPPHMCTCDDSTIIIANLQFADEMYAQLKEMKIADSRIIICDNENFFLREIFVE